MNDNVSFTFKGKIQLPLFEGLSSHALFIKQLDIEFINFQG